MEYILMDLEFNQPFDFEDGNVTTLIPECPFEIIQAGFVKMDKGFNIKETLNLYVKPQLYQRMHPFVKKITGITDEDMDDKKSFSEIYPEILKFMGDKDNIICIWGGSDVNFLYKNIMYYKLNHENLPKKYINLQQLAGKHLKLSNNMSIGLKNAVEALNIEQDADFHDALNDAIYTGKIFKIVDKKNIDKNILNYKMDNSNKDKGNTTNLFNSSRLYKDVEKLYGRKITRKEKEILKKVYILGRDKKYDFKQK